MLIEREHENESRRCDAPFCLSRTFENDYAR
jgi:hypothetical protein